MSIITKPIQIDFKELRSVRQQYIIDTYYNDDSI